MTEFEADLVANSSSMRRLMRWFILSSCTVFFGVGGWAVAAKVDSAVVTSGTFVVQSSAQAIQHLEGGVIGAILVWIFKDRDAVARQNAVREHHRSWQRVPAGGR